jgi:molecular chaperone DnaK
VSAKDKGTGKEQRITITASSGLAQEEIDQMVKDAEEHAEEDQHRREEVETRNMAETAAYSAEKLLADNAEKVNEELKAEIEGKVAALRTALQGDDVNQVNTALQELQTSIQRVGQEIYSQAGGAPPGGGPSQGDPSSEASGEPPHGTVEGEFREVDGEEPPKASS